MSENTPLNSPRLLKVSTPVTPTDMTSAQLQEAAHKQEELLKRYREMNVELHKFKAKTEEALKAQKAKLEAEKQKTQQTLNEIKQRNDEDLKQTKAQYAARLDALANQPLFDSSKVKTLSQSVSTMKSQTEQLKTTFSETFQVFLAECRATQVIAKEVFVTTLASKTSDSPDTIKHQVSDLQLKIKARCQQLSHQVRSIAVAPKPSLSISDSVGFNRSPERAPRLPEHESLDNKRVLSVSSYLSRFFSQNASLLCQ